MEDAEAPLHRSRNTDQCRRCAHSLNSRGDHVNHHHDVDSTNIVPTYDRKKSLRARCKNQCELVRIHPQILMVSLLIFAVLSGAGITLVKVFSNARANQMEVEAKDFAMSTGASFAKELEFAILPLFAIAQFATELEAFSSLPDKIGQADEPGSLPFLKKPDGTFGSHRNVTGVCNLPELVSRYDHIASAIKKNAQMDGILNNIQLSPDGVICLAYPLNNTEDFHDGKFLDSTAALGLDLLNDPSSKFIARESMKQGGIRIAGPIPLIQCPTCGLYFIARLPVVSELNRIYIDGKPYNRWGFATALINWDALVERLSVYKKFEERGFEFQLTRTDRTYNEVTATYDVNVVVLAESINLGTKTYTVSTALETTDNEWVMTVEFDESNQWNGLAISFTVLAAFCIAALAYVVLIQKQTHATMLGTTMAQEAKVEIERNMTAYFAHELRNPMSAIDSALASMPEDLATDAMDLIASMKLCTAFMSSIMNNLIDVRKMEEGKVILRSEPLSLVRLVKEVHKMALPTVSPGVELRVVADTEGCDWVLGDGHRLQQILANLVSNAIKYTVHGSVIIMVTWERELLRLIVQDTGPGIPKDEQEHMFERFSQRGGAPGSGLGLAIAKQLVTLMGGSIHFDSDPTIKPGTNCIVQLPLKLCEEPEEEVCHDVEALPLEQPLSILIIDDMKMNRAMMKRRFQMSIVPNCSVTEASTGEEALVMCRREMFDVIIVDHYMETAGGVMVGTDVIIAMRRLKVEAIIIGCSGNDLDDKFLSAGADFIWKKPIPYNLEIIRQLRQELRKRQKFPLMSHTSRVAL